MSDSSSVEGVDPTGPSKSSGETAGASTTGRTADRTAPSDPDAAKRDALPDPHAATAAAAGFPSHSVGFTLSSLGHAVARRFRETLAPLELEPREFALLRAVASTEGASQQLLGERLQIPPSRMVAFIDVLEQRGLVERRPNPDDRRARALYLTNKGRKLLAKALELAGELEAELCAELGHVERWSLLDMLHRVGGQLGIDPGVHSAHND